MIKLNEFQDIKEQYLKGNVKAKNSLVGKIMKDMKSIPIDFVNECILEFLEN